MRRAHFRTSTGAPRQPCTVTVEALGPDAMVRVRPYRSRRTWDLPLSVVAGLVMLRVARTESLAKASERRLRRRRP